MAKAVKHYTKAGKAHKGKMHKMPNGEMHSGAKHTSSSERLYHYGELSQKAQAAARKTWGK